MEAVGRAVSPCLSGGEVQTLPLPDEYLARVAVAFRFNRLRIPCILCVTKNKFLVEFSLVADDYEVSRAAKLPDKDVTQVFKFVSSADRWYSVLRSGSSCDVYVDTPTGFQQTKVSKAGLFFQDFENKNSPYAHDAEIRPIFNQYSIFSFKTQFFLFFIFF